MIGLVSLVFQRNIEIYIYFVVCLWYCFSIVVSGLQKMILKYKENVKKGDMIMTDLGSAVLVRQTRAKWFYLFKSRMASVSKSEFWELVDTGKIDISYVKDKKYRTKQRKLRTLDLTIQYSHDQQMEAFEDFLEFAKTPFNIAFSDRSTIEHEHFSIKLQLFLDKIEEMGLTSEVERSRFDVMMIRVGD